MSDEQERLRPLSRAQLRALEEACAGYEENLALDHDGDVARHLAERGVEDRVVRTFRLGVVGDPAPGHVKHKGRLAIPYLDQFGAPLAIRFRCVDNHNCRDEGHGKYQTMPGDPPRLFNVGAIHRADNEIDLCEGELDAVILSQIGLHAVALPGANVWKPRHRLLLAGFDVIRVWGDPDDAGGEFMKKVTHSLPRARGVRLTEGDVTETYLAGGAEALLDLIQED